MLRVAIVGATGYTGLELLRLLSGHPKVKVTVVTSRKQAGQKLGHIFPFLTSFSSLTLTNPNVSEIAKKAELAFLCVPHGAAASMAQKLLEAGLKVIDLSADFRLQDVRIYQEWYNKHPVPSLLSEAVYGLVEVYRHKIPLARLIANPGCYPTATLLPLIPLLKAKLIKPEGIIIDAKSGASGAGRNAKVGLIFCEVNEGFRAYKVACHRHTPEIEQELSKAAGQSLWVNFTTHLLPINRGILTTIYVQPYEKVREEDIREIWKQFYASSPFIHLLPSGVYPNPAWVKGTNFCHLAVKFDPRTGVLILLAAIDNLVKGASGQAIQNMNIMYGFSESLGLEKQPLFP